MINAMPDHLYWSIIFCLYYFSGRVIWKIIKLSVELAIEKNIEKEMAKNDRYHQWSKPLRTRRCHK